ncbi:MAG: MFS transporter, partial [Chloroflexi bacterium]|nr:MFS transporter [Chloroflexota bacterium]
MSRDTAAPSTTATPTERAGGLGGRLRGFVGDLGALKHPLFRRYWFGSLGAVAGTQFVILGTGWLVVDGLGGSPRDLGYVGAATAAPTILVNLFGGVLADRMDRRILLIVTSIVTGVL